MKNHRKKLGIAVVMLVGGAAAGVSQETRASLGGKVTDPHRAVIQKATVVVTNQETGVVETTTTNSAGDWRVQFLIPGHYTFEVTAPGFKSVQQKLELQVGDQKIVDEQLPIGDRNEVVNVDDTTPLIDPTAAVSGTVISQAELEELPSQSNSPTMLVGLLSQANVSSGVSGGIHLWSNQGLSGTTINAAGSGAQAVNYTIDGGTDTNQGGQVAFEPPSDAVKEFRVSTNAYDASIGRQSGGTIGLSVKNGTDHFHGTLYEMNQNNFLNATTAGIPLPVHYNEWGVTIGGPIWIPKLLDGRAKKTFFFFSYDAIHNNAPANQGYMSLPTMLERQGDFSQSLATQTINGVTTSATVTVYDPLTIDSKGNRQPFPNDVIPANRISPIAKAILAMMPAPDRTPDIPGTETNNYVKHEKQQDTFDSFLARFDQAWNNANHSYVNFRYNNFDELSLDPFGPTNILNGFYQHRKNVGITVDHTIVLSANFLLDARYNGTRYDGLANSSSSGVDPTAFGFGANFVSQMQLPSLPLFNGTVSGAEGGIGTTNANSYSDDTNHEFVVSLAQTHKNHNLKYGAQYIIQQEATGNLAASAGQFQFGNNWTTPNPNVTNNGLGAGSNLGSFLLGLPTSGYIPTTGTGFWSQHYMGFYAQDDWRVTSKFTLNFGLRWDYQQPVTERYNRFFSRFDPNMVIAPVSTPAQAAYASEIGGASTNAGIKLLQQYRSDPTSFQVKGGILYAGVNGTPRTVLNPRYDYFQPRLGFAFEPMHGTVLRGGLGRFVQADFVTGNQNGYSVTTPLTVTTDNYRTALVTMDNPYPKGLLPVTGNSLGTLTNVGGIGSFTDPNMGRVYVDEASAYLDQQVKDYLIEIGGTLNITKNLPVWDPTNNYAAGFNINNPSTAVWQAALGPQFDSAGRPLDTLSGNTQVPNPFKNLQYITNGTQNSNTVSAYSLLRPNPLIGNLLENESKGKTIYYAMNAKLEKRFHSGFSLLQTFTWGKRIGESTFFGPQVAGVRINRRLDPADIRFHYVLTPLYELPFGRGKRFGANVGRLTNLLIGGYEVTGVYNFQSGTPLDLPTNSSFFEGGDPSSGVQSRQHWFDTSRFVTFPTRNTCRVSFGPTSKCPKEQFSQYPSWTGITALLGYNWIPTSATDATQNGVYQDFVTRVTYNQSTFGDVRNPFINDVTLGIRKSFTITETVRVQLRMDAFNALNHPRFGNVDTNPSDQYFGYLGGAPNPIPVNQPRAIQLAGKVYF